MIKRRNGEGDFTPFVFQESLPPSPSIDLTDFSLVCEEISTNGDHEEFFNKKFDQLEKLHELYKSVSSISAQSQSRLELSRKQAMEDFGNQNLLTNHQRSASFSLTGLLGDLDNISLPSSVSDDMASLCSEPAWVSGQRSNNSYLDINRNTSLTSLLPELDNAPVVEEMRSHSPVLEGMDSQLAKYAQLKDLEVAYRPSPLGQQSSEPVLLEPKVEATLSPLRTPPSALCRRGDGASDGDSNPSPELQARSPGTRPSPSTLPRRSPGTGTSSSGSEVSEELPQKPVLVTDGRREKRASSERRVGRSETIVSQRLPENILPLEKEAVKEEVKEVKEKSRVIPRFSRLFGGMRRISRSPSQITSKAKEDKIRSKASKRQTKTSQISLGDSSPLKIENVIPEKPVKTKHKFFSSREKCSTKSPIHSSKNVKGTLSSGD